jgi:signal transduction histidine kinase
MQERFYIGKKRVNSLQHGSQTDWHQILRLRPLVGGIVGIAFALGQLLELVLLDPPRPVGQMILDGVVWGGLGGLAAWLILTWAARQERHYQHELEQALIEQRALNQQLQRSNAHLALLSEVNQRIAVSNVLDDILDAALEFPQRLVPSRAAALLLIDPTGPIETRADGASAEQLARWRKSFAISSKLVVERVPQVLTLPPQNGTISTCLVLPLNDGVEQVGWIELYQEQPKQLASDEIELLETISSEIAEAIISTRRRSREERAIYELERAIAEERARIARDIHDGAAQSLAFMRMRIDLWREMIAGDPQRLDVELNELKGTLREQIKELRRAIFALRPIQFDELGFVGGLHRYVAEFANQHSWTYQIDLGEVPQSLSPEIEAACFRIVQESLTNAAKHASPTRVEVQIRQIDQGLQIAIRDNGKGFDPGKLGELPYEHVGLRQMHERINGLRGQLTLLSRPNSGTEVRVWIPLQRETELVSHDERRTNYDERRLTTIRN